MCGIAGIFDRRGGIDLSEVAASMAKAMEYRGPDDRGVWAESASGIAFGHRRLAVVDLSPAGHQPMQSSDGRWVICYNGEIYSAGRLREMAPGVNWRGHSDTEALVEACAAQGGIERVIGHCIGMFALALWDRRERTLYLVRDRLGIKPLYWGQFGDKFLFASELKALRAASGWDAELDREAVAGFLRYGYVPAPRSIYRGIQKLPPGHILTLRPGGEPALAPFWDLRQVIADARTDAPQDESEAADQLDRLLRDAVGCRMIADVPLGALLSGGIDSSTVTALMQAQSSRPVKTFSIGFHEDGYNEADHAAAVAKHLGTDHTELYVSPDQAMAVIPRLPEMYDEPFADSSQIPTFLVSQLARRSVTVALSGDGGDELFAGYNRYVWGENLRRRFGTIPGPLRGGLASALRLPSTRSWDRLTGLIPAKVRPDRLGDKLHKIAQIVGAESPVAMYRHLVSQWPEPSLLLPRVAEPKDAFAAPCLATLLPDFVARMQYLDTVTYLPDDILTKVDRASMAVSLEARVPLLDHRVVAYAWSLPANLKLRGRTGKWLLRQVLYRYVPPALIDRPKMGFGVPIDSWLRGPLRDWAEDLLDERKLEQAGLFDPAPIRQTWTEHLSGQRNWQYQLWVVLMFQAWSARWMPSR